MNGARTTFMRRGYLLTALAAAVLLTASVETAEAQRVSIGFSGTSGMVSEKAFLNPNSLEDPQRVTIQVGGLLSGSRRTGDIDNSIGAITIQASAAVQLNRVTPTGYVAVPAGTAANSFSLAVSTPGTRHLDHSDEIVLVVAQSADGTPDGNWLEEMIELKLSIAGSASVSPDVFALTVMESHVAPVATFLQRDFTLSENSNRMVNVDIASGVRGVPLPGTYDDAGALTAFAGATTAFGTAVSVRVSNHNLVAFDACPARTDPTYNRILFRFDLGTGVWSGTDAAGTNFANTGVLTTVDTVTPQSLATGSGAASTAPITIHGCGDGAGIRDPYVTLEVMSTGLSGRTATVPTYGAINVGPPLMVSIDSDEAAPTLSFSPTDITINEGESTESVLLAEGPNASDVGMVKLMVEGDAMVDLYQGDEMLEEMGGYVTVDLGGNSSARLMAMSTSDPDLMDGDMAYKAWKLTEDSAQGVNIGEGYWLRVDVMGSTAVPALPLIGQLLLALFLMAGGSRLYRRRRG